jgi:superfamily I DNA and/or RNA helicase
MSKFESNSESKHALNKHNQEKIEFARESIEKLRDKILVGSTSNRNKLINFKHRDNRRDQVRIVDEIPDHIYEQLSNNKSFIFKPLPEEEKEPKDEQTQQFIDAYEVAKREDQVYLKEVKTLGEDYDGANKDSLKIERDLKDRVRKILGLEKRPTLEVIGIEAYAEKNGIDANYELPHKSENLSDKHKDKYLQTILKPKQLERKIRGIQSLSKTALTERGVNTLYLAIGFIEWVESEASDVKILSPLLLFPVSLEAKKKKEGYDFILSGGDGDIQVNIALKAKFEKDFGILIKDFEEEDTIETYLNDFQKSVSKRDRWVVKNYITLGHFYFAKMAMYYDLDPKNWSDLGSQQSLQDIFSGSETDGGDGDDYEVDDKEVHQKVPLLINEADASQFSAIVDVMDGKNVAIQGPPGTGKSQTIANIIGAALSNKKTVLFCAEKQAALDVVYKKLSAAGISDFALKISNVAKSKSEVLEDIKKRLSISKLRFNESNYKVEQEKEFNVKSKLIKYKEILTSTILNSGIRVSDIIGYTSKYDHVKKSKFYGDLFLKYSDQFQEFFGELSEDRFLLINENLDKIQETNKNILEKYKSVNQHPWYGFKNIKINPYDIDKFLADINALTSKITELENKIDKYTKDNSDLNLFSNLNSLNDIENLTSLDTTKFNQISEFIGVIKSEEQIVSLKELKTKIDSIQDDLNVERKVKELFSVKKSDFKKIDDAIVEIEKSHFFSFLSARFKGAKSFYLSIYKDAPFFDKKQAVSNLKKYKNYVFIFDRLSEVKKEIAQDKYKNILGKYFDAENTDMEYLSNTIKFGGLAFKIFDKRTIKAILEDNTKLKIIDQSLIILKEFHDQITHLFDKIKENLSIKIFFGDTSNQSNFKKIKQRFSNLDKASLEEWIDFEKVNQSFSKFEKEFTEQVPISNEFLYSEIFKAIYYNFLLKRTYDIHPDLSDFDGDKLNRLRKEFKDLDKSLTNLKKQKLFNELASNSITDGIKRSKTNECTEFALIDRILSQKAPRIKLRELIKKSSQALLDMKPCFIMSPTALSELVAAKENFFDLLIIDEASQMRMENSISALARSKQCVIVGDLQQLPPGRQFEIIDEDDDEDEDLIEESILDRASSRFRPNRMLKWHYRSRHHSLIDFSNHHFYENKLVIPPSPITKSAVVSNKVESFYKGKINVQEKDALIKYLINFMKNNIRKDENDKDAKSCLIVTMNIFQKESIEDDINKKRIEYPEIDDYENSWVGTGEEFTIKNLENVQGDERDVIFVSTVYGPDGPGASTRQNFGQINQSGGQRRLNVLFTRAKKELHLYTSMNPSDIQTEGRPEGCQIFSAYLEYAKTGRIETGDVNTDREPPTDFQIFVGEGIKKMGYDITHEVGVSGFFIDIGVKHKSFPDGFILGVECDGRAYHSSKSARDRDILRQEILEGLGWNIYRIWSTDWFKDPQGELVKLDRHIKKLLNK